MEDCEDAARIQSIVKMRSGCGEEAAGRLQGRRSLKIRCHHVAGCEGLRRWGQGGCGCGGGAVGGAVGIEVGGCRLHGFLSI